MPINLPAMELNVRFGDDPDLDALAEAYPELRWFFSRVHDYRVDAEADAEEAKTRHAEEVEELRREISNLEDRNVQLRRELYTLTGDL